MGHPLGHFNPFYRPGRDALHPRGLGGYDAGMENHSLALHLDWALFASTFALIFLAELPDKTALAALILATRNHPLGVFIGASLAFLVQNIVAVSFGSLFGLLEPQIIHAASGILFLVFALFMWRRRQEERNLPKGKLDFLRTSWKAFLVIFIAEWGDLTQLAAATLVARTRQPWTIFVSATLALWATTALAVAIGHRAKKAVRPHVLQNIAAVVFALVGVLLLSGFWDK
jgi:Ca2+/H+ antiporter, TMEM165/GDT1 family